MVTGGGRGAFESYYEDNQLASDLESTPLYSCQTASSPSASIMRVGCLQFSPVVGDILGNMQKADKLLEGISERSLDLLVLPELALTGYNFPNLKEIKAFLSVAGTGPSCTWAQKTALRLKCFVSIGYPEKSHAPNPPGVLKSSKKAVPSGLDKRFNYNANIIYSPDGEIAAHYRKSFLFPTDLTWASEPLDSQKQPEGFSFTELGAPISKRMAQAICMDINPYKFQESSDRVEFARHVVAERVELATVSMAWSSVSMENVEGKEELGGDPDVKTLAYWVERFKAVVDGDREVLVVLGNRSGAESDVLYAGSSLVAKMGRGMVSMWDILGRGEERLLVVDTDERPKFNWKDGLHPVDHSR